MSSIVPNELIKLFSFCRQKNNPISMFGRNELQEIREIFSDAKTAKTVRKEDEIKHFVSELDGLYFPDDSSLPNSDKFVVYYIAGNIARSAFRTAKLLSYMLRKHVYLLSAGEASYELPMQCIWQLSMPHCYTDIYR